MGWDKTQQKPAHAFRNLMLESAVKLIIEQIITNATTGIFNPAEELHSESRWSERMHDWFRINGAGCLSEIDLESSDRYPSERGAFKSWSDGKNIDEYRIHARRWELMEEIQLRIFTDEG